MNSAVKNTDLEDKIFTVKAAGFEELAFETFRFQYDHNKVYGDYCRALSVDPSMVRRMTDIPFLPISFFKTHCIAVNGPEAEAIFESSGTTGSNSSKHFVNDLDIYRKSFLTAFKKFYGQPDQYCVLGLLPSYLERKNSSLVMMVDELIRQSQNNLSGFYLDEHDRLYKTILHNEILKQPTILIGVTYALLDFVEKYQPKLRYSIVMETGGMKGRREEMTRQEVNEILKTKLGLASIHSEYGMTELLSQAYSKGDGYFYCPAWMKVLIREEDDPLSISAADKFNKTVISGAINIIDLANINSCAFIATDDAGRLHPDGRFEVIGRLDNSDIRGCSLLAL